MIVNVDGPGLKPLYGKSEFLIWFGKDIRYNYLHQAIIKVFLSNPVISTSLRI